MRTKVITLKATTELQYAQCSAGIDWEISGKKLLVTCREGGPECQWKLAKVGDEVPPNMGIMLGVRKAASGTRYVLCSTCVL